MAYRARKVADLLKEEISLILQREIKDPRIDFITITNIKVSGDLKQAKVYFSTFAAEHERNEILEALTHASQFIRVELKKVVHLKYIPYLRFYVDDTFDYVNKIENLIDKTKEL